MKHRVSFKLTQEETDIVSSFSKQVGMSISEVARKSLFMTIRAAYSQAQQLAANSNPEGGTSVSGLADLEGNLANSEH